MENIVLQFLNIYFWVFISLWVLDVFGKAIIKTFKPDYEFKDDNSSFLSRIITLTLFISSIILT